ncbi:neuroendocrine convertase 2 [Nephila pilipes]|uniref:Neuroendocrine convertase 2 n=1 Tax=Nephila pilipes TaxID=299642 RepID=A0A8X6MU62_NEPPI|nr:neuroendocrine convertase 2 [Nephila pilipes]
MVISSRHTCLKPTEILGSDQYFHFVHHAMPHVRRKRSMHHTKVLKGDPLVAHAYQQTGFKRVKRGYKQLRLREELAKEMSQPTDPYFPYQWYLKNVGQNGGKPKLDLNVEAAWAQGYTGKNITTAIMDDGVDYMHPDLRESYNARASYDFSSNDPFPYPRYTDDWFNSGTLRGRSADRTRPLDQRRVLITPGDWSKD